MQAHQKTLLTTQLNFPTNKAGYAVKRSGLGSGYSSRNAESKLPSGAGAMSSKAGMDPHRGSNDYLRMKRVSTNVMNNIINASMNATGTGVAPSAAQSALAAAAAKNGVQQK